MMERIHQPRKSGAKALREPMKYKKNKYVASEYAFFVGHVWHSSLVDTYCNANLP